MHESFIDKLICPACHGPLAWAVAEHARGSIETGEACCDGCAIAYPVHQGIGVFLPPGQRGGENWAAYWAKAVQEDPELDRKLMQAPLETLLPADLFLRAQVLAGQGKYAQSEAMGRLANQGFRSGGSTMPTEAPDENPFVGQFGFVAGLLASASDPVIDFASGGCAMVRHLAKRLPRTFAVSDVSVGAMEQSRGWLRYGGLEGRVSQFCFDAKRMPFRSGSVETMTTFVGFQEMRNNAAVFRETRRVVSGRLLAVSCYYSENDAGNAEAIREFGMDEMFFREPNLARFRDAGWSVEVANEQEARAYPTPKGRIHSGTVNRFPVVRTTVRWCTIVAR